MIVEESLVEKLQRQFRKKLQNLREEQEGLKEHQLFANILPLKSRSPERGSPFPSQIYYSFSFQKFSPISKFERAFEVIK